MVGVEVRALRLLKSGRWDFAWKTRWVLANHVKEIRK